MPKLNLGAVSGYNNKINRSFISTEIKITNTGSEPIEDYKIFLNFEGEIQELADTNEIAEFKALTINYGHHNTALYSDSCTGRIVPKNSILVGDDTLVSEDIFIKPKAIEQELKIKWKLISKDFKDEGELIIKITPEIEKKRKFVTIDDASEARTESAEVEDYLEQIID